MPGVYAVGDVIGPPALASTSMEQGRRAVCHALGRDPGSAFAVVPTGIYSVPEISTVGMTEEQAQRLVATASAYQHPRDQPRALRDRALCVVGLETGMRRMSLESMLLERTGMGKNGFAISEVKLKGMPASYRFPVPLSTAALAALEPWVAFLRQNGITKGPIWRSLQKRIGGVKIGKGFTSQAIYDVVVKHAKTAKIDILTPHIFRHTFISWRLDANWTPQQVAAVTGHQLPMGQGNIGAMHKYADPKMFGPRVSTATPEWLLSATSNKG